MKFNHDVLFVSSNRLPHDSPSVSALTQIQEAIAERGFHATIVNSVQDAMKLIKKSPKYSTIGLYWDPGNPTMTHESLALMMLLRQRSVSTPLLLFSEENITDHVPLALMNEISEYIYLFSETPSFTANRIYTLVQRYAERLLPPYFKTLKNFTEDGDYYWDCPGHMGGMAYVNHPVGIEFINFFGENMMRADIGVATAEMGDYLVHIGPPQQSEKIAAKLFGADWTFYGVSGSNRIVTQGAVAADEIALVDRNCHKSLNHGLTLSQARPVYLKPTRSALMG